MKKKVIVGTGDGGNVVCCNIGEASWAVVRRGIGEGDVGEVLFNVSGGVGSRVGKVDGETESEGVGNNVVS